VLVEQVHRKTGGNPLFMRELLRLWMSTRGSEGLRAVAPDEGTLPAAATGSCWPRSRSSRSQR
jgi:hypothetical protein